MTQSIKHIVTVGTSSVDNYKTQRGSGPTRAKDLQEFIAENPREHSAELNALVPFIDRMECNSVHLVGSNTHEGTLASEAIGQWLQSRKIHHTGAAFDPPVGEDSDPYASLLNLILQAARSRHGQTILINTTGGFKGQAITAALAARLLDLPAYYIFESMTQPVFLPTTQPTPAQIQCLRALDERAAYTDHANLSTEELTGLERSGMVFLQRRQDGGVSSIKLTEYAKHTLHL